MGVGKYVGDVGHYDISYDTSSHSIREIVFVETMLTLQLKFKITNVQLSFGYYYLFRNTW